MGSLEWACQKNDRRNKRPSARSSTKPYIVIPPREDAGVNSDPSSPTTTQNTVDEMHCGEHVDFVSPDDLAQLRSLHGDDVVDAAVALMLLGGKEVAPAMPLIIV